VLVPALPSGDGALIVAVELLPRLLGALGHGLRDVTLVHPLRPHEPLPTGDRRRVLAAARRAGRAIGDASLDEVLAEWLRHYGPVSRESVALRLGLSREQLVPALDDLADTQQVVVDRLLEGTEETQVCDAENLARLLRMVRAAGRPQLPPQPVERLPLFLAVQQGLAPRKEGIDGLQSALERLLGWAAPATLWETDLLPARLDPYQPAWLDTLLQDTDVLWTGVGRQRVTFLFPEELPLLGERATPQLPEDEGDPLPLDVEGAELEPPQPAPTSESGSHAAAGGTSRPLFPGPGRFTLPELLPHTGLDTAALTARLWNGAWEGELTNDTFAAVRRGALNRFAPSAPAETGLHRPRGRHGFDRWQASRAFTGRWYPLPPPEPPPDPLEREERNKERARLLLQRYGVVFRELANRELPTLQWRHVFRALRLMELAGEAAAGAFFDGVPGPQFASPAAIRRLRRDLPEDAFWWCSALDPASPCGLALEGLRGALPRRVEGNHLVFLGSRLAMVSEGRGRRLRFELPPDHPRLADCLELFRVQLTRSFAPWRSVEVQEVNGEPAATSPYAPALLARFQVTSTAGGLRLWRRY
jgi:ATP-dependent Lhr-like helicase